MTDDFEKIVYSDEVIAFTALASQYCNLVDRVAAYSQSDFVSQQHRLLSLLYVKTLSLPSIEPIDPEMVEKTVTQEEWDEVHNAVAAKLAKFDRYSEVYDPLASVLANKYLVWGAGPRASQYLILGAKAHAAVSGKYSPDVEDVKAVAPSVLRHRIVRNYKAEAENVTDDIIIAEILKNVKF